MKRKLLLGLFLGLLTHSFAQLPGWSNLQPITITENSGLQVVDYQLKVTINTQTFVTAGQMNANGDDIRFTSSCSSGLQFPYWIESGMNTPATVIWVKIDTLQANASRTIFMQFGNASVSAISAVAGTFVGPHSSTDSVSSGGAGGATTSQRGFRFAPTEDVLVTAFGKREPNGTTRYVTLFDFATQAILQQTQVGGPAAEYSYQNIPAPIWLTQGTQYLLQLYQGASDGYYFGTSSQIGQHLTYFDMRYCNSCTENTFPTNTLTNYHYGTPDFWYFTKKTVSPAPSISFSFISPSIVTTLADDISICFADSALLSLSVVGGELPYSYSWTNNNLNSDTLSSPNASPTDTTVYTVTITDACSLVATDSITVNVLPLPDATILFSDLLICNGEFAELTVSGVDSYVWSDGSTNDTLIVMPSATTTYGVTVTGVNLCTAIGSYTQQVVVPATGSQTIEICDGAIYTYNNHVYTSVGTYIDTIAGVTNCDSIVTTEIIVNALPTGSQSITVCFGGSYSIGQNTYLSSGVYIDTISGSVCDSIVTTTFTVLNQINTTLQVTGITLTAASGASAYQWINCSNNAPVNGATSNIFEPVANGNYAVIITDGNCSDTSACSAITTIGLEELDLVENISVFPNPSNGNFTLQSSISQAVSFVDALGHVIQTIDVIAGQPQTIELSQLNAGIYFLTSRTKVIRLVIE